MSKAYSKAFASIESVDEKDYGPNGGFTAVLSTPSEDRDGDELFRNEWKDFTQERYPLDIDHGMSVADTIGSFRPYFDGEKMMMEANFAGTPKAQDVRALVTPDPDTGIRHIGSVSVAFMVDKTKKSGEARRELLNAGVVAIPSNRDAVILASKAASALRDAFSDDFEGDVPDEVKDAVLETLGAKDSPKPYGDVRYADPEDGKYPIDTVAHIRAALAYINVQKNYDALGDHAAHVKRAIEAAARAHGIEVSDGKSIGDISGVEAKDGVIYVDVIPRINMDEFTKQLKAAGQTASGIGGDGALVQAIHDASSHLGAACPVIEVTDEGTGADDGANKSITFTSKAGRSIEFDSHDDAREFFKDMLESIDSAESDERELVSVSREADEKSAEDAFEKALDEVLTPEESPADGEPAPADEAAAASPEAADAKAKRSRALQLMQMAAELNA